MKQLLLDLYWEAMRDLEKIHKSRLLISKRVALEKAVVRLETVKKILDKYNLTERV